MHAFQQQDCTLTLSEGLAEYYASNPRLKRGPSLSLSAQEFFRCHDAAHIVFGCDTSLPHEAAVKLSSMLGTTAGLSVLRGYALHDSLDIYRTLSLGDILRTVAAALVIVPRTALRCLRQKKRWPWTGFDPFLHTPLRDIRREFGIHV
jgi:hypothetical protein